MKEAIKGHHKTLNKRTYFKDTKSVLMIWTAKERWRWDFPGKTNAHIGFPSRLVLVLGVVGLLTGESEEQRSRKPLPELLESGDSGITENLLRMISAAAQRRRVPRDLRSHDKPQELQESHLWAAHTLAHNTGRRVRVSCAIPIFRSYTSTFYQPNKIWGQGERDSGKWCPWECRRAKQWC